MADVDKPFKTTRLNYSDHGDNAQYPLDMVAVRYAHQAGFNVDFTQGSRAVASRPDMPTQAWELRRNRAGRWEWLLLK